jgi:hypothetical protein
MPWRRTSCDGEEDDKDDGDRETWDVPVLVSEWDSFYERGQLLAGTGRSRICDQLTRRKAGHLELSVGLYEFNVQPERDQGTDRREGKR